MANNLKNQRSKKPLSANQEARAKTQTEPRSNSKEVKKMPIRKRKKKMSAQQYGLVIIATIGFALLLGIAIYYKKSVGILAVIRSFSFGSIGITAYLLPIMILVSAILMIPNQGSRKLKEKIKQISFLLILISIFTHILMMGQAQIHLKLGQKYLFFPALANYYRISANHYIGGGFLGGLFGDGFLILLGKWGSIIVFVCLLLAMGLMITEISLNQLLNFLKTVFLAVFSRLSVRPKREQSEILAEQSSSWEESIISAELAQQENEQAQNKSFFRDIIRKTDESAVESPLPEETTNKEWSEQNERNSRAAMEDIAEKLTAGGMVEKTGDEPAFTTDNFVLADESQPEMIMTTLESVEPEIRLEKEIETASGVSVESEKKDFLLSKATKPKPDLDYRPVMAKEPAASSFVPEKEIVQNQFPLEAIADDYNFPPLELLKEPSATERDEKEQIESNVQKLEETLLSFGVNAKVINVSKGPTVTRYEIQPAQGVKVSRIVNLTDDIALNLAAAGIRMEAPIPGKSAIGIEVPNREAGSVVLREVLASAEFEKAASKLSFGLGKDITGKAVIADIAKMPHLLIAGATGSGKSVCINTLIVSLLYKARPEEVKLLMIDPKVVELSVYNGIPHLLIPVVTDPKKAAGALNWAVQEMNDRYKLFAATNTRDLRGYNQIVKEKGETAPLPQIVIIIDELADLMMVASSEVEDAICRLAQMARAAGLHLIIATQRPSVDVITGLIKANVPSRIAFNVSSGTDSRTILDMNGAEKLLGKGDMLFYPMGYPKPVRIQGPFISDHEVENIVEYLKAQKQSQYSQKVMNHLNQSENTTQAEAKDNLDELFSEALELVVDKERASASMLQRQFRIGFNRAARLLDQLTETGYVGEDQGSKPREVLITKRELEELKRKAKASGSAEMQTVPESSLMSDAEEVNDAINDLVEEIQNRE